MRKKLLFLLLLLSSSLLLDAQIMVKSFIALESDMTASSLEGRRVDQNGEKAALIKVVTTETGFVFEGGSLGIVDTKQEQGEIWVWVPRGLRKITIKHHQLGVLRDYYFPMEIEAERTYEMVLVTAKVETIVKPTLTQQFLVFKVVPKNALVTVNDMPWPVDGDGVAQKRVDFGNYTYRIEAPDYHTTAGKVEVNDPNNKTMVEVELRHAFGYLKVEGENNVLSKSSVYIDNAISNNVISSAVKLSSGQHQVRVLHPMYKPFVQTVTIKDDETFTLKVNLNANFSTVTLKVDDDAEIFVNEDRKGIRQWTGDLESGKYLIECRKENHRSSVIQRTITENMMGQTIVLEPPTPITGMLVVSSSPSIAQLYVDGKKVGETPMQINDLIIGKHVLRFEKEGCAVLTKTVVVEEDKTLVVEENLVRTEPVATSDETKIEHVRKDTTARSVERGVNFATLNVAYSPAPQTSYGFTFGSVKRLGWFVTAMSNFGFDAMKAGLTADAEGLVEGQYYYSYTGESCKTRISAMAGLVLKVYGPVYLRLGAGYGCRVKSWYTTHGDLIKMEDDSVEGVDVTAGIQMNLKGIVISLDAVTTNFNAMEAKLGIGYCWRRK